MIIGPYWCMGSWHESFHASHDGV